jgi:LuxR family transcriptional regulator, maltose regulon positive regulatory protein
VAHAATASVSGPDSALAERALLELKGRPVPVRSGRVSRERLVRRLIDAREVPVALIVAPAGYGKTTVLSEWAELDGRPFAWVTLDDEDNDARSLLSAIAFALDDVEPVGWEVFEALGSQRPDAPRAALRRLVRALARRELPLVLALDDVHVVQSRESRHVLTTLWQAAGAGLQLALASRSDSRLPVGRLRAIGSSVELRTEDLAMTRSEAAALLRLAGLELAADESLVLTRRTEGWPAGLYLAALTLLEQAGGGPGVEGFPGDGRLVADYVHEEFLAGLSSADLDFLTRTSVLDRLSGPVCDALLDRSDSADVLAKLERSNLLIVPLDRRHGTYRYHQLLAAVLRSDLHRRDPDHGALLHRRASAWWARQGDAGRAIDHSIDGRDHARAAELLWDTALQHVARGDQRVIWGWLNRYPEHELADTPLLPLVAAGTALVGGDLYETERWTSLARSVPDDAAVVQGGLALMRAGVGRHGAAQIAADAARAHELLGERSPWRPLCLLLRGVALHLRGEVVEARDLLEEGAHLAAVSAPLVQALCLSQLALLLAGEDDLERATVLVGRARAQIGRHGLGDCPTAALVFAVSAELRARFGEMGEATVELRHALRLLTEITDPSPWYEVECRIAAARAGLRLGGSVAAEKSLNEASRVLRRIPDAPVLQGWIEQAGARLDLVRGSTDGAAWSLTAAELRVLRYLPSHLSFREIAERLFVSPNTVKTHARGIYRKLSVSSRGDAVDRAHAAGLVGAGAGDPA